MLDADLSHTQLLVWLDKLDESIVPVHLVVICLSFLLLWRRFVVGWLMVGFNNLCALFDDGYGHKHFVVVVVWGLFDSKLGLLHAAALLSISHDLPSIGPPSCSTEAPVRSLQVSDLMVILRR